MDAASLPLSPSSRIVIKRTFIEEVHSPREPETLRVRACSDSALYEMGEEEERRQMARQTFCRAPGRQHPCGAAGREAEVEFELHGLSDAETASEEKDDKDVDLPCYAYLNKVSARVAAEHAGDPAQDPRLVDRTPEHRLDAGFAPTFANAFLALPALQGTEALGDSMNARPRLGRSERDCAISSDSGSEEGRARGCLAAAGVPQMPQDFERLVQENQRLTFENHMLREYYVPIPDGFGAREGSGSAGVAIAPGSWVFSMGIVAMPADMSMVMQQTEAQEAHGAAQRVTNRRQRGGRGGAASRAAGASKGFARGSKQVAEGRGSDEVTSVPEHLRTTVMLRNLPNNYSRAMLLELLDEEGFAGKYNFLYLPIDFKSRACLGYAFINLIDPSVVPAFWTKFDGFSGWILPSKKVCHVSWSGPHQGLGDHIERYRNSPIMHPSVVDEYKPVIFQDGVQVLFPEPTKTTRAPRIRNKPSGPQAAAEPVA